MTEIFVINAAQLTGLSPADRIGGNMQQPKYVTIISPNRKTVSHVQCSMPISFDREGIPLCFAEFEAPVIILSSKDVGNKFEHTVRISTLWVPRLKPPE